MEKDVKWTRFNSYLKKHIRLYSVFILISYLIIPLALLNPYLSKLLIDKAYLGKDLGLFWILIISMALTFFLKTILTVVKDFVEQHVQREITFDLTKDLFNHLQKLPLKFFKDKTSGELVYKMGEDVHSVSGFVFGTMTSILILIPELLSRLFIVFYLDWQFALVISILSLTSYAHPYIFSKRLTKMQRNMTNKSQDIFEKLYRIIGTQPLVKSLGKENYETKSYGKNLLRNKEYQRKQQRLSNISHFSSVAINTGIIGLISVYAGYQVVTGSMSLGALTAILLYSNQLLPLIRQGGDIYQNMRINSVHRNRLAKLFSTKPEIKDSKDSQNYWIRRGEIELRKLYFEYKKGEPIFKDLSLKIPPGSKIALVGGSGCGKSTIFSLILRLYDPQGGSVRVDNQDIKGIKLENLKQQIGISMQDTFLWNGKIKENILYGSIKNNKDYEMAASITKIDKFIKKLPEGYNSDLSDQGSTISEGQKQRIAIARAIIKKPKILLLDESMSNLDSKTEEKILNNLLKEFKNSTVILTSHRLSAVKKMDLIYFIDMNKKINIGTHTELLKNKEYRELFGGQVES